MADLCGRHIVWVGVDCNRSTCSERKEAMICHDCGPIFEAIHGTCPLCGQVMEYDWDVSDEDRIDEKVIARKPKRKGVRQ